MPAVTAPPRPDSGPGAGRRRAWSWVAHLESGGSTPWAQWPQESGPEDGSSDAGRPPGAQQLELLRRLNQAGRPTPDLVRRVLSAPAVGRGRHDVELIGAEPSGCVVAGFGPAPADPADLTADDLLRVAVGLLAEDLVAEDLVAEDLLAGGPPASPPRRTRRLRTRYRLVGDPELAGPRREALRADGRPPGGAGAHVLVLGTDLATMFGHAWTAGAFAEGGPSWPDYLAAWRQRDGVPRRIDLPAIAERWRADPGTGAVDVVLDPARAADLLRMRRRSRVRSCLAPGSPLVSSAAELSRRTAVALGLLVPAERRPHLLATGLRPRLADRPGTPPSVPAEHRDWVGERARRMRDRLLRSGFPVVGDPDALVPTWPADGRDDRPELPSDADAALDLAVVLLLGGGLVTS